MLSVRSLILIVIMSLFGAAPLVHAQKATAKSAKTAKAKLDKKAKPSGKVKTTAKPNAKGKASATAKKGTKNVKEQKGAKKVAKDAKKDAKATKKVVGKDAKAAKTKTLGKDAKSGKIGKDPKKDAPASETVDEKEAPDEDVNAKGEKTGIKGKNSLKSPKVKTTKGKFAAKTSAEELDEEFDGEEPAEETSSGPWLLVFVLFIVACVAGFLFLKKRRASEPKPEDLHFESNPEAAFTSGLSSLDIQDGKKGKKKISDAPETKDSVMSSTDGTDPDGGPDGGGGGKKKKSWKDNALFAKIRSGAGSLKDKAKSTAAVAAKNAAGNIAGDVAGGLGGALAENLGGAVGGDLVGGLAGDLAANAASKAANKAVTKKIDQKFPGKSAAPAPGSTPDSAPPALPASGGAPLPPPGNRTAHAEAPLALMDAEAQANAPGASLESDGPSADAENYDKPLSDADWLGWDKVDPEEFWYRVYDVEAGGMESDEALERRFKKYGFRDKWHFDRVKDSYMAKFPQASDSQYAMNARMRQMKEAANESAKKNAHLLEPVAGVSLEAYAKIMARKGRLTSQDPAAIEAVYKEFGTDSANFEKAHAGWQDRMQNLKDPATMQVVMGEYAKHFAGGSSGQFAGAAQAGAASMDRTNIAGIGSNPAAAEPCTLERYIEIMSAQKVWAEKGQDIGGNLQKHFGITIMDFSDLSQYWSPKIHANVKLITDGTISKLEAKYEAEWRGKAA